MIENQIIFETLKNLLYIDGILSIITFFLFIYEGIFKKLNKKNIIAYTCFSVLAIVIVLIENSEAMALTKQQYLINWVIYLRIFMHILKFICNLYIFKLYSERKD